MTDLLHRDTSTASLRGSPIPDKTRRRLLGAGAAIATPVLAAPAAIVGPIDIESKSGGPKSRGYQETGHVRAYYTTTRI
jgi:hypothetical protein